MPPAFPQISVARMTVERALSKGTSRLALSSSTPRLDAEILLSHALGKDRSWLLAHSTDPLPEDTSSAFTRMVERRATGEPVAYITGHKEFYGLDFIITPDVLVPRPETESLVEACLESLPEDRPLLFADVGTGSGVIAVAVCKHRPLVQAYATEISEAALSVARANVERHGATRQVTLLLGHLLVPLTEPVNVIAANLPYVSPGEAEPDVALWEPQVAVYGGGEDGSYLIREFLGEAPRYLLPGGSVVLETAYSQGQLVASLASQAFPSATIEVRKDLAGYDRIVVVNTEWR